MKSLYEINEAIYNAVQDAESQAIENDGIISEEIATLLDGLEMDRKEKIGNICKYYKSLLAEAEMVKTEEKNLAERRKTTENKAERLKNYLATAMNGEKYSDSVSKISFRKSESVEVFDVEDIPEEYQKIKIDADKTAIKNAIKAGKIIEGCKIVESNNIQIK